MVGPRQVGSWGYSVAAAARGQAPS